MALSNDALIFGLAYLNGPRSKLSFGGDGAQMAITDRARAALNELIESGYVEPAKPDDQIKGREHWRGVSKDPHLGELAQAAEIDFFDKANGWPTFSKIAEGPKPDVAISMTSR